MEISTVVHRAWPTHPRLCIREGVHVLVVWPCGKVEHPLHAEHVLDIKSYPWPESELRLPVSDKLLKDLRTALEATQDEAIRILLPHRDKIKNICDAAPKKLFSFGNRPE